MYKVTVKIEGMMCGMCEAHICDTIRRAFPDDELIKQDGIYRNFITGRKQAVSWKLS